MSELLDELARTVATPMPRSRVLRLIGGTIVAAAVPGFRPRRAAARANDGCNASGGGCISSARCCYTSDGYAGSCCPWYITCSPTGSGLCHEQVICEDGRSFCGPPGTKNCCGKDEVCVRGVVCVRPCPADQQVCGQTCCPRTTECVRLRAFGRVTQLCLPKCPAGRSRCGANCCPPRWRCADPDRGLCKQCGSGQVQCGRKCCNRATQFCGDPAQGLCCKKDASSCPTGPATARRRTCCNRPSRCLRQLPSESGALTAASQFVCCPPNRIATNDGEPYACCAPGQVPLGGKLVVGFGIQGLCCNESQVCGSGASITCCQRFSENIGTDLNQTCCNGRCVTLNYDPQNCGACGRTCPPGKRCARGVCTA